MEAQREKESKEHVAAVGVVRAQFAEQQRDLKKKEKEFSGKEATVQATEKQLQQQASSLKEKLDRLEADKSALQRLVVAAEKQNISVPTISLSEIDISTQVLGTGGFASVYKAKWRGNTVAVKRMLSAEEATANSLTEEDVSDLFYRELKNLCRLRHRNVINVLAACVEPGKLCLVMDFCKSGDLRSILSSKAEVTAANRIKWAIEVARGFLFMHTCSPPLCHRDVKSSNILIDSKGNVAKIIDFGLCTAEGENDWSFTSHGLNERSTRGTPAYMSPGK